MKKLWAKKEYLAVALVVALFISVSMISLSSIRLLQGNARVVNYVGIVRGATQKLIKEEIMGWYSMQHDSSFADASGWYPDDALVARLDSIVDELLRGEGPNNLVVLQDETYLSNMRQVQAHWAELKELIAEVREGAPPDRLFDSSQQYFELVNDTVFSAEIYSEAQVKKINSLLISVNVVFVLLVVAGLALYVRSISIRRRAEALGKIAYVDPLTGLDNRASCERLIRKLTSTPEDKDLAVFMFDMNDLKLTNDFLGHQGGDRIIAEFARILKSAAEGRGFVGRFGGDEFLAVFSPGETGIADAYLHAISRQVKEYNDQQENTLQQIHYAAGYTIANASRQDIEDIIHEADNLMYQNKRKLKGQP